MVENKYGEEPSIMDFAAHQEKRAKELGIPVGDLIPLPGIWKGGKNKVKAVRRIEPPSPDESPSWTTLVSEAMKRVEEDFSLGPQSDSKI